MNAEKNCPAADESLCEDLPHDRPSKKEETRHRKGRELWLPVSLIALCCIALSRAGADVTVKVNLLQNPGAESSLTNTWYESEGDLQRRESSSVAQYGDYYFYGDGDTKAYQDVSLTDYSSYISTQQTQLTVASWLRSNELRDNAYIAYMVFSTIDGVPVVSALSNWSPESYGDKDYWQWYMFNSVPMRSDVSFVRYVLYLNRANVVNTRNDANLDGLVVALWNYSQDLNFGSLYKSSNPTQQPEAEDYNLGSQTRQTIVVQSNTPINWRIVHDGTNSTHNLGSDVLDLSSEEGFINPDTDEEAEIDVNINPISASGSTYSARIAVEAYIYDPTARSDQKYSTSYFIGRWYIRLQADLVSTPTVSRVLPSLGSNDKVNVAVNEYATFEVEAGSPTHPDAASEAVSYQWSTTQATGNWSASQPEAAKEVKWSSAGNYTLYCRMVDVNGVGTLPLSIPVHAWARPSVGATPPTTSGVYWGSGSQKFAGKLGQATSFIASATAGTGNETINRLHWDFNGDSETDRNVSAGSIANYTWSDEFSRPNTVSCKAVTNYGIESESRQFGVVIYKDPQVQAGGPYDGKPGQPVTLDGGSIVNLQDYANAASVVFQWKVRQVAGGSWTNVATDADGVAQNTWSPSSGMQEAVEYGAKLQVTVTTAEGLVLSATSDTTAVTIEAGRPTAMPGGPYRGGIKGGNFTPVQFEGNLPDFVEDETVGRIAEWSWSFGDGTSVVSGTVWNPTHEYATAGTYSCSLKVKSEFNKWSSKVVAPVEIVDGKIAGYVRAADLRTPVAGVRLGLESSHVDPTVLGQIAGSFGSRSGYFLALDGVDDYARIDSLTMSTQELTIEFWVRTAAASSANLVTYSADGDVRNLVVQHIPGAGIRIQVNGDLRQTDATINDGEWHHLAVAMSNLRRMNIGGVLVRRRDIELYKDGDLVWSGMSDKSISASGSLFLGKLDDPNWTGYFDGWLDEIRVWSQVRTATEIQTDMDRSLAGNESGLVGYWPVGQSDAGSIADRSAAARAGGLVDGAGVIGRHSFHADSDGAIWTETDDGGYYAFEHIPLGSYRLVATRVDAKTGEPDFVHEFETSVAETELTLDTPTRGAVNFVDLSVFPVSGRIVYSIQKDGTDVFVKDVVIKAMPVGSTSDIESLASTRSPNATGGNYSLPLFAGRYLFKGELLGRDIRLIGTHPDDASREPPVGYDALSQLVTIEQAVTTMDFIDYTTRDLTVYVEDSGGFPIDEYQENKIIVDVIGDNGHSRGQVQTVGDSILVRVVLPPGKYSVSLPNVPTALVKGEKARHVAEVDLSGEEPQRVTMVVPVQIVLDVTPPPMLFNVPDEFLDAIGLSPADNPEGYMIYFPPEIQQHTYEIRATANGNPVEDFTMKVVDDVSQLRAEPAPEVVYPDPADDRYSAKKEGGEYVGHYTLSAGLPNWSPVDESDPSTYMEYTLPDTNIVVKVPMVQPKRVIFQASKDGYADSDPVVEEVTVLGDVAEGSVSQVVSVPNVNYLVLHDPPGDGSYSYLEDSMTIKGMLGDVTMKIKDIEIPVYPSPWSVERTIDGVDYDEVMQTTQDLGGKGLLGYRNSTPTVAGFTVAAAVEAVSSQVFMATGPVGYVLFLAKMAGSVAALAAAPLVQYEIGVERKLATSDGGGLPDLMGPGKGDVYYGEGWTLGLQSKYRLGVQFDGSNWAPYTALILTYDILDRDNQYFYTVRDIERIVENLELQAAGGAAEDPATGDQREKLEDAVETWTRLLESNPAYVWQKEHVEGEYPDGREDLEDFLKSQFGNPEGQSEMLIFSGGGAKFEYSREISEANTSQFSTNISVATQASGESEWKTGPFGIGGIGPIARTEISLGGKMGSSISTTQGFGKSWDSGTETKQKVGFVLSDDDVGDNISTYVYQGPWGTPIFFTDPGSVTSDPWQEGTNKGVDVKLEMLSVPDWGPFDYRDGAHYQFLVTATGIRELQAQGTDFIIYNMPTEDVHGATVRFNGVTSSYGMMLGKGGAAVVNVSVYPPEKDWGNSAEQEYPVVVEVYEAADNQIWVDGPLQPRFADLRSPRATITAPYDGQRISPEVFTGDKKFEIQVYTDDEDAARIQLQIRSKTMDGVWEPWQNLPDMDWEDGETNENVTMVTHEDRDPERREFTFAWSGADIASKGVGEYALRAVAGDLATRLMDDGTQEAAPNEDLDAPVVQFIVDGSKPTVLTTVPDYQARESERIYRSELSALFNDDMRGTDFSDRTFAVTDLLSAKPVAGFVSYSPALRKATFVPVTPFQPNGLYMAEIKTDKVKDDGSLERGVHDLAGNPLDNAFMWTFRTADTPFEETWSIALSVGDGTQVDGNKIASVAFGALDEEDELDARVVPGLADQLRLVFLDREQAEFERDTRPADGRLCHHWFFAVENAADGAAVTLRWRPSLKLTRTDRPYQIVRLTEFDDQGRAANVIDLDPALAGFDATTGLFEEIHAYTYPNSATRTVGTETFTFDTRARYFRLDVQKSAYVAGLLEVGTSGWKFFSVPITPQRSEPFVNLGDDIDPFKLYQYDAEIAGYRIYPLDLGQVGLRTGYGYFTLLARNVEVDVGGAMNQTDVEVRLQQVGWHAIGNPFYAPVTVSALRVSSGGSAPVAFAQAVADGWVEGTLYRWQTVSDEDLFMGSSALSDAYVPVEESDVLVPWEGYWLKSVQDDLVLTVPVPSPLPSSPAPPDYLVPAVKLVTGNAGSLAAGEFELRLALRSRRASDLSTVLGTRQSARAGRDGFDGSEPPVLDHTVALFFDHAGWAEGAGRYDRDFRPALQVGEEQTWQFTAFADQKGEEMTLSWEEAIGGIPDDILLHFRPDEEGSDWQDMRAVRSIDLRTGNRLSRIPLVVRATRFALETPAEVSVVAGEKRVEVRWNASDNPFITGYAVERRRGEQVVRFELSPLDREFIDRDVEAEVVYAYCLATRFASGTECASAPVEVEVLPEIDATALLPSFPNPFNPEVWIPYELAAEGRVVIEIYDLAGQLVRRLDLGVQGRGRYADRSRAAHWDGRTGAGEPAASGVYLCVLRAGDFTAVRKMTVLK